MKSDVKRDPYMGHNFLVEIAGIVVGGFNEVSGLNFETEQETRRQGGMNEHDYKFPKGTKTGNITLKRGLIARDGLWSWYQDIIHNDRIVRRNGVVHLLNSIKESVCHWEFFDAYPTKWEGSGLNAQNSAIITDTFTLACNRLKFE